MDCTVDNIILVSASDEGVYASLITFHKLPIELCLFVSPDKDYRKLVVNNLRGRITQKQLIGCFTIEEQQQLLKKERGRSDEKTKNVTIQAEQKRF